MSDIKIGIIGATGAVGVCLYEILINNNYTNIKVCASDNRVGKQLSEDYPNVKCEKLNEDFFNDLQVTFFCSDNEISKKWIPYAESRKIISIDNSSHFRLYESVPLIVPEINKNLITKKDLIIANPNCSSVILCMSIFPLFLKNKIKRIDVSTYQAVSGAGIAGLMQLRKEMVQKVMSNNKLGEEFELKDKYMSLKNPFNEPILENVFSHNSDIDYMTGYNGEELKIIQETCKIIDSEIEISATCIRVPVPRSHSEAITITFENDVDEDSVRQSLKEFKGVTLIDDKKNNNFPTPQKAQNNTDVFVGRIRADLFDSKKLHLFACGDQILKGASYNAFQIFEYLIEKKFIDN